MPPFSSLLTPPFHPNSALGGGTAAIAPAKGQIPPSLTPLFTFSTCFSPIFLSQGKTGVPPTHGTLTPGGPLLSGGVPNLGGVPSSMGVPRLPGVPNPGGVPVSSGIPHLSGVPHLVWGSLTPWGPGGPSRVPGPGEGDTLWPPKVLGSPHPPLPPQPQVLGVSQVWGGRRPPALTQPCSCSAPGRGRSPAAASLALVGGGIN